MKKENVLLDAMYLSGVLAGIMFIVAKSETLMYVATATMFDDGDVYRFAKVRDFKVPIAPMEEYEYKEVDPDTATLLIVGDSFSDDARGHLPIHTLLAESLATSV